jgi:hypothetical protein
VCCNSSACGSLSCAPTPANLSCLFIFIYLFLSCIVHSLGFFPTPLQVAGNPDLARAINASLYALMCAVRPGVTYSSSPGGLATNAYNGHTFWDVETWMWPTWLAFHPDVARDVLKYVQAWPRCSCQLFDKLYMNFWQRQWQSISEHHTSRPTKELPNAAFFCVMPES